jgi:pimeloyl-ACP methyl ester carboxylesterase
MTRRFLKTVKSGTRAVTLLVIAGVLYEQIGAWRDAALVPQIGRSVDIGGRSLNLYCSGEGSPTVVFDSGRGLPGYSWLLVQPGVAELTRACWYDRAGYGWSDAAPAPHRIDAIAEDLHRLLQVGGVPPPYVLVGHSFGGLDVRMYYELYPGEVAGMVLVDPSHEGLKRIAHSMNLGTSSLPLPAAFFPAVVLFSRMLGPLGVLRLLSSPPGRPARGVTPEQWATLLSLHRQLKIQIASIQEGPEKADFEMLRRAGNLRDLPLVVVTAGKPSLASDAADATQLQAAWVELLGELARQSTRGRQIVVKDSGHMIPYEAPDSVIDAVRAVVAEVRHPPRSAN